MTGSPTNNFRDAIKDDESLKTFLTSMKKFDERFTKLMFERNQFTIKLEVHGDKGDITPCRVYQDAIERPIKENPQKGQK